MTEEEAKTKWCPQMMPYKVKDPSANWGWDGKCLGSACMMWRRGEKTFTDAEYRAANYGSNTFGTQHGFCGLAGKP